MSAPENGRGRHDIGSGDDYFAAAVSDTVYFPAVSRWIWVNNSGLQSVVKPDGTTVSIYMTAGVLYNIRAIRVNATGSVTTHVWGIV